MPSTQRSSGTKMATADFTVAVAAVRVSLGEGDFCALSSRKAPGPLEPQARSLYQLFGLKTGKESGSHHQSYPCMGLIILQSTCPVTPLPTSSHPKNHLPLAGTARAQAGCLLYSDVKHWLLLAQHGHSLLSRSPQGASHLASHLLKVWYQVNIPPAPLAMPLRMINMSYYHRVY